MQKKYIGSLLTLILSVFLSQIVSAQTPCYNVYFVNSQSGCQGTRLGIFPGDTITLDTTTTYYDTIQVVGGGCDSVLSAQVFVSPIIFNITYDTICASQFPYQWNGHTLTGAGTAGDTLFSIVTGCDSVIQLNLASRSSSSGYDTFYLTTTYCLTAGGPGGGGGGRGYRFYGTTETASGTYSHIGGSVPGNNTCADSVVILYLTVGAAPVTIGVNPGGRVGPGGGGTPDTIRICSSSYDFYGTTLTTDGNYSDTLISSLGCDSVYAYITLVLNSGYNSAAVAGYSCGGAPFVWRGNSYAGSVRGGGGPPQPAVYYDTVPGSGGCDTIYTITVNNALAPRAVNYVDSFCAGSSYVYDGNTFTTAGIDTVTAPNPAGCDSTIILHLSYKAAPTYTWVDSFCDGSSYTYRGHTYTDSGAHFFTEPNPAPGCDSIIIVYLSYKSAPTLTKVDSFCQGTSYTYRGTTYTTAGVHSITVAAPSGCDSIINLDLRYTTPPARTIAATICQGTWFYYGSDSFNTRGINTFTVTNPGLCDSVITLNLTVTRAPRLFVTDSFCQGTPYIYAGNSYDTAGTYTVLLAAPVGCDTNVTLTLTYKVAPAQPTITQTANVLLVNPLVPDIQWYLNGTAINGATSQTYIPTQSGVYSVTTQATGACASTSVNDTIIGVGINQVQSSDMFTIYPNPNNGKFTIETTQFSGTEITVYDVLGRVVIEKQMQSSKETLNMGAAAGGTYYIVLKNQQFTAYSHFVITQ